jgi:hypothetical protein
MRVEMSSTAFMLEIMPTFEGVVNYSNVEHFRGGTFDITGAARLYARRPC